MHYRMFFTMHKEEAKNSTEARTACMNYLNENGFSGDSGRFSSPMCDWYEIGGRWSGEFAWLHLDKDKKRDFWQYCEENKCNWESSDKEDNKRKRDMMDVKFKELFPKYKGDNLLYRSSYEMMGHEDDAMIVDLVIWKEIKTIINDREQFCDMDDELNDKTILKDVIDKYWAIMIDYHT